MATNCWLVRRPMVASCFQRGFWPRMSVPMPSATSRSMMDAAGGRVQSVLDPPGAACRESFDAVACPCAPQLGLELGCALVVDLVDRLDWPPVDETRDEARFV